MDEPTTTEPTPLSPAADALAHILATVMAVTEADPAKGALVIRAMPESMLRPLLAVAIAALIGAEQEADAAEAKA